MLEYVKIISRPSSLRLLLTDAGHDYYCRLTIDALPRNPQISAYRGLLYISRN